MRGWGGGCLLALIYVVKINTNYKLIPTYSPMVSVLGSSIQVLARVTVHVVFFGTQEYIYSQLSPRRTPSGLAQTVCLSYRGVQLIESLDTVK